MWESVLYSSGKQKGTANNTHGSGSGNLKGSEDLGDLSVDRNIDVCVCR
jgi:hypothetical protein